MPDLIHELPLSWREPADESAVTSDWRAALSQVMLSAAAAIDERLTATDEPDVWTADFLAAAKAEPPAGASGPDAIRASAAALEGGRRVPIRRLDRAVYAYLDLCERLGIAPALDDTTSGAVALARAASAPTPIRAVIKGHRLRASDAGWSFGSGPELQATVVELLNFLGGRSLQAPRPGHD